jgi:hypothetical protein
MSLVQKVAKVIRISKEKITHRVDFSHTRPLRSDDINVSSDVTRTREKIALILQGPLILRENFTVETVKLYKKTFSESSLIIISTWKGEDPQTIKALTKLGAIVLENKKPEYSGIKHINLQIVSTVNGIKKAKELGATYILKTRTDQRMYAPNIEEFLCSIISLFPVAQGYEQQKRIIGVSLNTFKYRPYSISDMTLFGTLYDMERYFDVAEDKKTAPHFHTIRTWSEERLCEVYLSTNFLEKVGRKLSFTLKDSWEVYRDHFCIIDAQSLDLFWYKYEYWKEYPDRNYKEPKNTQELNFREWLILYSAMDNKKTIPEKVLEQQFGDPLSS